ncbi:transmembrane protein 238-like [Protopterus annectens]|uniref:transmembrane protein 238-like n=1 Tax=Protopterus annectens TaxID=7888 RepID=UPI001CFA4D47|nr:transmembrane protein 238-like [Protopterus annectens]
MAFSATGLGRCACAFWLAVTFDVFGLTVLLIGVFANVFFYDFLIYAGAIIIFLSLIWWIFWYTGNIEVPPEELEDDVGLIKKQPQQGVLGLVRRVSNRISNSIRRSNSWVRSSMRRNRNNGQGELGPSSQRSAATSSPVVLSMAPAGTTLSTVSASVEKCVTFANTAPQGTHTETSPI